MGEKRTRKRRTQRARARRASIWLKPSEILIDEAWNARDYNHPRGTGNWSLEDLIEDIKRHGLLQNLVVRPNPEGRGYILVAGHLRHRALMIIDKEAVVLCQIKADSGDREADDFAAHAMNLSENLKRADLQFFEIANKIYLMKRTRPDLSLKGLPAGIGLSYSYVAALYRLRKNLIGDLWELVCTYGERYGHGITYKDLLPIAALPKNKQQTAWDELVAERTNTKSAKDPAKKKKKLPKPHELEEMLGRVDGLSGSDDWRKGVRFGLLFALGRQTWHAPAKANANGAKRRKGKSNNAQSSAGR